MPRGRKPHVDTVDMDSHVEPNDMENIGDGQCLEETLVKQVETQKRRNESKLQRASQLRWRLL